MENLPAVQQSMFFDVAKFEHSQRVAKVFAESTMVPDHFKGNIGNVLIAMNFADRIGADIFMVMQSFYVIHGKPGIEGKLALALVNNCGRFEPLEFDEIGNLSKPVEDTDGCLAYAKEIKSGKVLKGPMVDWAMVKAEGWYGKKGSKWQTIAPLMFRYRAATYFARSYCPEVLLGMQTREELQDIVTLQPTATGTYEAAPEPVNVEERLKDRDTSLYDRKPATIEKDISPKQLDAAVAPPVEPEPVEEETPLPDWDPLKNEVQTRYGAPKRAILQMVANDYGIKIEGMKPAQVHHAIIKAGTQGNANETPEEEAVGDTLRQEMNDHAIKLRRYDDKKWHNIVDRYVQAGKIPDAVIENMPYEVLFTCIEEFESLPPNQDPDGPF